MSERSRTPNSSRGGTSDERRSADGAGRLARPTDVDSGGSSRGPSDSSGRGDGTNGRPAAARRDEPGPSDADDAAAAGDVAPVTDLVDVLSPVAGIRRTDLRTYRALLSAPKSTTHEIGQEVDRHRSSVNRSLDRLRAAGLVSRRRRVLDAGGHAYVYRATPPEEARESLHDLVEQWVERAHERVAELDRDDDRDGQDGTDTGGLDPGAPADV